MTQVNCQTHQAVTVTNKVAVIQTTIRAVTQAVHREVPRTTIKATVPQVIPAVVQVVLEVIMVQRDKIQEVAIQLQETLTEIILNSSPYLILFFNNTF